MPKNKSIKVEFNNRQNIVNPDIVSTIEIQAGKFNRHYQTQIQRHIFQRRMLVFVPRKNTHKKSKVFGIVGYEFKKCHV
jgi:hypothetical protein